MNQMNKQKGRSRRKVTVNRWLFWKKAIAGFLSFAMVFSNVGNSAAVALAKESIAKEEFRIYGKDIQEEAEKALEQGGALTEESALEISGKDKTLVRQYEALFQADGSLYELFPEIDRVKDVDGIDLRVFLRVEEDADPESYMLTGEEKLLFLYVNSGGDPVGA